METDRKWIVVRIDGKLAGISRDYDRLADISTRISAEFRYSENQTPGKSGRGKRKESDNVLPYSEVTALTASFEEIIRLRETAVWEDFMLFGTEFQKKVWKTLWKMSHPEIDENTSGDDSSTRDVKTHILSYSDFAELCDNKAGVRAVAHAIGLNPLPVIIPCHLIVPKEAIDKIEDIRKKAESTIFKGEDLSTNAILEDTAIDFGEYALGKELKRRLIQMDLQ